MRGHGEYYLRGSPSRRGHERLGGAGEGEEDENGTHTVTAGVG